MALRKIQAREQDSWAQVAPPTVQLLNLQLCSAARLKEAAESASISDLIFLGWWWEGSEGLIRLPPCPLESRTTEADVSETSCNMKRSDGAVPLALWEYSSLIVLIERVYEVTDSPTAHL